MHLSEHTSLMLVHEREYELVRTAEQHRAALANLAAAPPARSWSAARAGRATRVPARLLRVLHGSRAATIPRGTMVG
ncbi:hypothetical protein [Sanguibacter antarcticus]|uniref:Uncharacterized protein n=1 Tax=Sanguibacter antarcticus TaxID=372484 RepID=A0A2A9E4S6_9MICO|nr:hypothetical protein [Sanguibacter antarcticus]PFG34047.1 hypothetical protein ATL42_1947 [Sanguibacter antarcticus]